LGPVTALVSLTADRAFDEDDTRLGAFISLSTRLGGGRFARMRYDTLTRATIVEAIQPARSRPGAFGWGAAAQTRPGASTITGDAAYVSNRFEAEASHELNYADPGSSLTEQRTRANLAFSIAAADNAIAVGRPIGESFAIVRRHRNLGSRALDIDTDAGAPRASAGALGPALLPDLSSYRSRRVEYDIADLPPGYDLGRGEFEVRPPVYSGYALRVGSDAAATALGSAILPDGSPVRLAGARVVRVDGSGEPVQVFTNRSGRFVAAGLSAGRWRFEVNLGVVYAAEFTVPETAAGLVQAGVLQLAQFEEIRS
jgi:outer membrane usher protein